MSEVRMVVREAGRDWSGTIHGSMADRAIAALSADPATMEELEAALSRFEKPSPDLRPLANLRPGLCDEPYDAGLVVIDLAARFIAVDSTYSSPSRTGYINYHNGKCCTDTSIRYHLADDWVFSSEGMEWRHRAEDRRREKAAKPILDAREVFYGRPLLEYIARETFATFMRRDEIAAEARKKWIEETREWHMAYARRNPGKTLDDMPTDDVILMDTQQGQVRYDRLFDSAFAQIHATWLLTPREDLGGACPREIALDRRGHITWDLQDRCEQWSSMKQCPRGLAKTSHAYRLGGFGTHELVVYYYLIRHLLWSCWEQLAIVARHSVAERVAERREEPSRRAGTGYFEHLTEMSEAPDDRQRPESFLVGDFLTSEVPRLEKVRDTWLESPEREFSGRKPRTIIEHERARFPEVMSRQEALHDPDCPCCQMMADMPGPMFWGLDGSSMDDDFAFDIWCRTREDREEKQHEWEERSRKYDSERAECKRLGVSDSKINEDGSPAIWSRSFKMEDTVDLPLGIRVFGIGCRLAELIVALRDGSAQPNTIPETQQHIDELNRHFGNLRELLQGPDSSLAEALIDPVLFRFTEMLDTISSSRPDLSERCSSMTDDLRNLLSEPAPEPDWDSGDLGIPF